MEKIILFQVKEKEKIEAIAQNMRIHVEEAKPQMYMCPLKEAADGTYKEQGMPSVLLPCSLMLFCHVSNKHLDKMLFELRQKQITVDFKAVLTPTNQNWTVMQLYQQLMLEKLAFEKRK